MVDSQIQGLLDAGRDAGAPGLTEMGRDAARDMIRSLSGAGTPESPSDVETRDLAVGTGATSSIPGRLYTPAKLASPIGIVFYHGGGFTVGDLDTYDEFLRRLATASGLRVLAVEYRLAPEHPFPAAHEDSLATADWALAHAAELGFASDRIIVVGDSAGGNLAASVALTFHGRRSKAVVAQALLYPWLQFTDETVSLKENAEGYLLTRADLDTFAKDTFKTDADRRDPRAAILDVKDLEGVAPAIVVTAGYDPLRDEGLAYAEKLRSAGVAVEAKHYPAMVHAFYMLTGVTPAAQAAIDELGAALSRAALEVEPAPATH
jgi:acetyl esterase